MNMDKWIISTTDWERKRLWRWKQFIMTSVMTSELRHVLTSCTGTCCRLVRCAFKQTSPFKAFVKCADTIARETSPPQSHLGRVRRYPTWRMQCTLPLRVLAVGCTMCNEALRKRYDYDWPFCLLNYDPRFTHMFALTVRKFWSAFYPLTVRTSARPQVRILHVAAAAPSHLPWWRKFKCWFCWYKA